MKREAKYIKNSYDEKSRWCLLTQKRRIKITRTIYVFFSVKFDVIVSVMGVYGHIIIATYWGYT
jgi:hypothetical protein